MKPLVLGDMDGVLCDFDLAYYEMCQERGFDWDCEFLDRKHRFADGHLLDKAHRDPAYAEICAPGWFLNLPPIEGAIDGFLELAEHVDLWICTKPMEAAARCHTEKAQWVRKHLGEEWERRLILAPDKSKVRGDVLLDDAPKIEWLPFAEWEAVIFPHPFNGAGSRWEGMPNWQWGDDPKMLVEIAEDRRYRRR